MKRAAEGGGGGGGYWKNQKVFTENDGEGGA